MTEQDHELVRKLNLSIWMCVEGGYPAPLDIDLDQLLALFPCSWGRAELVGAEDASKIMAWTMLLTEDLMDCESGGGVRTDPAL